jgi:lipoprotein-releasing system permease protein
LNFEYFISRNISPNKADNYARPVIVISYTSIALGLALMIISVSVVIGFKRSISDKIIGFTSHLQIIPFDNNASMEERPINVDHKLYSALEHNPHVTHIQFTSRKAAVIKTDEQIQGVVLKGIGPDYDLDFLGSSLTEGDLPEVQHQKRTDDVLISERLANRLEVGVGDDLRAWFVTGESTQARGRKFTVSGLFNTSLEDFDNIFLIGDIRHVQKLNDWEESQVGSIELMVDDPELMNDIRFELYRSIPFNLQILTVIDQYPQIFNWLALLDTNVIVILTLLIIVAAITMVSTLLIIIIERTNMVGLLKALGADNRSIRKIFLYKATEIIVRGMVWGNLIGVGFYLLQEYTQLIKLPPEDYYVAFVPVELNLLYLLLLNVGTLLVCLLMLLAPSYYITRIQPARALRYE